MFSYDVKYERPMVIVSLYRDSKFLFSATYPFDELMLDEDQNYFLLLAFAELKNRGYNCNDIMDIKKGKVK